MIAMLRQMTDAHYTLYLHSIQEPEGSQTHQNLADFLTEIILVFKDLITSCVFPHDWNEIIMVQNQVFLKVSDDIVSNKIRNLNDRKADSYVCDTIALSYMTSSALKFPKFSNGLNSL